MNIQFNPNGNTQMTLRNPTSVNSKVMGFGRPAIISGREESFTKVYSIYTEAPEPTDETATVNTVGMQGPTQLFGTEYYVYFGFTEPFNATRLAGYTTDGSDGTIDWMYLTDNNATAGTIVPNIQETVSNLINLSSGSPNDGGIVYWDMPGDWTPTTQFGNTLYWILLDMNAAVICATTISILRKTTPP